MVSSTENIHVRGRHIIWMPYLVVAASVDIVSPSVKRVWPVEITIRDTTQNIRQVLRYRIKYSGINTKNWFIREASPSLFFEVVGS